MSTAPTINCDVKNFDLADLGKKRIEWANQSMKVLQIIRKEFIKNQPLKGIRVSACLHVTAETANLMIALRDGGADVEAESGVQARQVEVPAARVCRLISELVVLARAVDQQGVGTAVAVQVRLFDAR